VSASIHSVLQVLLVQEVAPVLTAEFTNATRTSVRPAHRARHAPALLLAVDTPVAPELATLKYLHQQVMTLRGEWNYAQVSVGPYRRDRYGKIARFFL
jgi:hypothetical protein